MDIQVIQDWTDAHVALKRGSDRDVRYQVFQDGTRLYQEIRGEDDELIYLFELPKGMAMNETSFEVLLRFVLTDIVSS
ncbi:MAG: hypothetical protein R3192_10905 [Woeseiaceae bacterium]|nr:hypothetical protein [Woeseiaceae bacterium]